jgi:hypothetical protein
LIGTSFQNGGFVFILRYDESIDVIPCKICKIRRPRRYCPGVQGDICSLCCGTEREVTVSCPFSCEYLQEARIREKPNALPDEYPNKDIRINEEFVTTHEGVLIILSVGLALACLSRPEIIDYDAREALEALISTYRALQSGLLYEAKPTNPLAAFIYEKVQEGVVKLRERVEAEGSRPIREAEVLGVFVFLQRMELHHNNGRRKGRAFIDFMRHAFPVKQQDQPAVVEL